MELDDKHASSFGPTREEEFEDENEDADDPNAPQARRLFLRFAVAMTPACFYNILVMWGGYQAFAKRACQRLMAWLHIMTHLLIDWQEELNHSLLSARALEHPN